MNPLQKNGPRTDSNPVFIHSQLDDLGLSASQFRVYCHLARRSNAGAVDSGIAWPSVAAMSRVCRLHPSTVRQALAFLLRNRLICSQPRPGKTTVYRLNRPPLWSLKPINPVTPQSETEWTTHKGGDGHPLQSNEDEGSPCEGNPKRPHTRTELGVLIHPLIQDIEKFSDSQGFPAEAAKKFYLEKSSVGWVDRNGRSIKDWRPALEAYVTAWKAIESRKSPSLPTRPSRSRGAFSEIAPAKDFTSTKI